MKLRSLSALAGRLSTEVQVLFHAARDPECPARLRWFTLGLLLYALSPIDLVPDFIPLLGWLDDLIILPLGLAWVLRRLPSAVLVRARTRVAGSRLPPLVQKAANWSQTLRWGLVALGLSLLLLLALGGWTGWALWRWLGAA